MRIQIVVLAEASGDTVASEIASTVHKALSDTGIEVAAITIEKAAASRNDNGG